MISTSENFRFDFVSAPRNREAIVLEVRAGQGARVALSDQQVGTDWMYQVVIGDADNTISWIGRGKHGEDSASVLTARGNRFNLAGH